MVFTSSRSGTIAGPAVGGLLDRSESDPMRIYNPYHLPVKLLKRAAGGESILPHCPRPPAIVTRATLAELPVQPPGSPTRFTFPPRPPELTAERRSAGRPDVMSEDDRIASIVARALSKIQPATKPEAAAVPTFAEFLESVHLPAVQKKTERDERTLSKRRLFERVGFCGTCKISWRLETTRGELCPRCGDTRIFNPGIDLVDSAALANLATSLTDDDGNPATAAKRLRYLMTVLNDATERGLIRKVKKPRIAQDFTLIRTLSDSELLALYKAAESAVWPRHPQFSPADFWRAFLVMGTVYGLRLGELTSLPWSESVDRKKLASGFHWSTECPHSGLRNLELRSPFGWLVYLPQKQANAKPLPLVLPVTEIVSKHLQAIRGDRRFVFDVYSELKTRAAGDYRDVKISLYRQWYALTAAAGIPDELKATPHDLRRTQETRYDLQFGKGTGGEVNGHASRSVSDTYYSQAVPRIFRAVNGLQLPAFA
jgi:integrase